MDTTLFSTILFLISSLSDFCLLQHLCASWRLLMSHGCPPLLTGTMWSIVGDRGCGYFKLKSTGLPQIPQTVWVFMMRARAFSYAPRFPGRRSVLISLISPSPTKNPRYIPEVFCGFCFRRRRRLMVLSFLSLFSQLNGKPI